MSLRKAVNAKCKECIYDPYQPGAWKQQVQACTSPKCPLFPVRPISSSKNGLYAPILDADKGNPAAAGEVRKAEACKSMEPQWK